MRIISLFFGIVVFIILGLTLISPKNAVSQPEMYIDNESSSVVHEHLSNMSKNSFFVLPIINLDAHKTLEEIDEKYLSIGVEKKLALVLDTSGNRFSEGDHFVIPITSGRNNLCFLADDLNMGQNFILNTSGVYTFDELMILHEMAHCQYRFSDDSTEFDDFMAYKFAEYVMKEAVDKTDRFRVTASALGVDYVDLYHEIYSDLFVIGYMVLVEGNSNSASTIAEFRNNALITDRDIIHWTSPHIGPFVDYISILDSPKESFDDIHSLIISYLRDNLDLFNPKTFLEMMVAVGKSQLNGRDFLDPSDFNHNKDLDAWIGRVLKHSEEQ